MMIARRAKLSRHTPHMRPAAHKNVHAGQACTFFLFKSVLPYTGRHRPVRKGLTHGLRAFLLCRGRLAFHPEMPVWQRPLAQTGVFARCPASRAQKAVALKRVFGRRAVPACVWHAGFRVLFRPCGGRRTGGRRAGCRRGHGRFLAKHKGGGLLKQTARNDIHHIILEALRIGLCA